MPIPYYIPGFQLPVVEQLWKDINNMEDHTKWVVLIFDEMKVKDDLVYDKHTGSMVGFIHSNDVEKELEELSETSPSTKSSCSNKMLATNMLTFMVRSICSKFELAFGHFPTRSANAEMLYDLVWEAVQILEGIGLKVIAITCDGASSNRKFFKMHAHGAHDKITYKTRNIYASDQRWIYFFSDVPHLLKTVRNSWLASGYSEGHTRLLTVSLDLHPCT